MMSSREELYHHHWYSDEGNSEQQRLMSQSKDFLDFNEHFQDFEPMHGEMQWDDEPIHLDVSDQNFFELSNVILHLENEMITIHNGMNKVETEMTKVQNELNKVKLENTLLKDELLNNNIKMSNRVHHKMQCKQALPKKIFF